MFIKTTIISSKIPNTKEDIRLKQAKRKPKRAAQEWYDSVLQEQLKSLMYFDRSLRVDPTEERFIDELNFKKCLRLRKNKTSNFFVGITLKKVYYSS